MSRKFNSNYDIKYPNDEHLEKVSGVSFTVPDLSYSIREILQNFTSPPQIMQHGQFEDEVTFEDTDPLRHPNFDLTDLDSLRKEHQVLTKKIQNAQRQKDFNEKQSAKAKEREQMRKEILKEEKEKQTQKSPQVKKSE